MTDPLHDIRPWLRTEADELVAELEAEGFEVGIESFGADRDEPEVTKVFVSLIRATCTPPGVFEFLRWPQGVSRINDLCNCLRRLRLAHGYEISALKKARNDVILAAREAESWWRGGMLGVGAVVQLQSALTTLDANLTAVTGDYNDNAAEG